MIPFDRAKYASETFALNDISNIEDDPVALQLKAINIRIATDNAQSAYQLAFAHKQTLLIACLSLLTSLLVAIASAISVVVNHLDSESSTASLVQAIRSPYVNENFGGLRQIHLGGDSNE